MTCFYNRFTYSAKADFQNKRKTFGVLGLKIYHFFFPPDWLISCDGIEWVQEQNSPNFTCTVLTAWAMLVTPLWSHYFGFTLKFNLQIRFCSWLPQWMSEIAQLYICTSVVSSSSGCAKLTLWKSGCHQRANRYRSCHRARCVCLACCNPLTLSGFSPASSRLLISYPIKTQSLWPEYKGKKKWRHREPWWC